MKKKIISSVVVLVAIVGLLLFKVTGLTNKEPVNIVIPQTQEVQAIDKEPQIGIQADWMFDVSSEDELSNFSEIIVSGKFIKKAEVIMPFDNGMLYTKYTFKVDRAFKGNNEKNQQIEVVVPGGEIKVQDYIKLLEEKTPQLLEFKSGKNESGKGNNPEYKNYYDMDKNKIIYQNYGTNPDIKNGKTMLLYLVYNDVIGMNSIGAVTHGYKEIEHGKAKSINDLEATPEYPIDEIGN